FVGPGGSFTLTRADAVRLGWDVPAWVETLEVIDRTTVQWCGKAELLEVTDLSRAQRAPMTVRVRPVRIINPFQPIEGQAPDWVEVEPLTPAAVFEYLPADAHRVGLAMIRAARRIKGGGESA